MPPALCTVFIFRSKKSFSAGVVFGFPQGERLLVVPPSRKHSPNPVRPNQYLNVFESNENPSATQHSHASES